MFIDKTCCIANKKVEVEVRIEGKMDDTCGS